MKNLWIFVISILMVCGILITLSFEPMYNYFVYASVIKNSEIDTTYTHIDYLLINTTNYPAAIKNIELLEDESINVIFDSTNQKILGNIPNFTYEKNLKKGESFVFNCQQAKSGTAHLSLFEYFGTAQKDGMIKLIMKHGDGLTKRKMPCNYPEVIEHSINMVSLE